MRKLFPFLLLLLGASQPLTPDEWRTAVSAASAQREAALNQQVELAVQIFRLQAKITELEKLCGDPCKAKPDDDKR